MITKDIKPNTAAAEFPKKMTLEFLSIFFVRLSSAILFKSDLIIRTRNIQQRVMYLFFVEIIKRLL
jgi:hypothetical protein